jgi:hypothetical protein
MSIKSLFYITFVVLLVSCAGYFNHDTGNAGSKDVSALRISGSSETLSSDTANDICPFLFRDALTGNAYLFFSSDRDVSGNYKIYRARMESDETFQEPVLMDATVNGTGNNVISPDVFRLGTSLYIAVIAYSGAATNINTYKLDESFNVTATLTSPSVAGVRSLSPFLGYDYNGVLICNGTPSVAVYLFDTNETWTNIETKSVQSNVDSLTGMGFLDMFGGKADAYFIMGLSDGQFSGMAYHAEFTFTNNAINTNEGTITTNFFSIPEYQSLSNDITPYVDVKIGMENNKVYFASDRRGTYDLYRYNKLTFEKVIK